MRSGTYRLGALAAGALLMLGGAAGCGRDGGGDNQIAGKTLFVQKCGSCHTLSRAQTKGIQGPNLDEAFGPARSDGLGESTVAGVVRRQIAHTRRGSIMQSGLVKGADAKDVAAYVAAVAGQGGKDLGALASAGAPKVSNKPIPAKGGKLEIDADPTGALAFASTMASSGTGTIEIASANKSQVQHNIALQDGGGQQVGIGKKVANGGVSQFSADLKPGKYTFLCTVPGHEAGGMKGTLTVK